MGEAVVGTNGPAPAPRALVIAASAADRYPSVAAQGSKEPLTLVVRADKSVTYDKLINLGLLAREAGIQQVWMATRPNVTPAVVPKT